MTDHEKSEKNTNTEKVGEIFADIFTDTCETKDGLMQGLENLNSIPNFSDPHPPAVKGKEFIAGVMGFRKTGALNITVACGKAQVRSFSLPKFIAMIENMHDPATATIMLQNFSDQDEKQSAKGQILGRINAGSSAIHIIQGLTSRIIRNASDIALFDVYYIDRVDLTSFYLAAKAQIGNGDQLETMIAAYDGWKAFDVPLDPLNPYGD